MRDSRSLDLIIDRVKYLGDKKLSDLSTDEIEEYLELCNCLEIKEQVRNMWESVKSYWEEMK